MPKCPMCKKSVGSLAKNCWYCGAPLSLGGSATSKGGFSLNLDALLVTAIALVLLLIVWDVALVRLAEGPGTGPANIVAYDSWVDFLSDREETSEKINYTLADAGDTLKIFDTINSIDFNTNDNYTEIVFQSVIDENWLGVQEARFDGDITYSYFPGNEVVIIFHLYQSTPNIEAIEENITDRYNIDGPYEMNSVKHA